MQLSVPDIKIEVPTRHNAVTVPIIFRTTAFLSAELAKIPSNLPNVEGHGHKYLIMTDTEYKKLDKANAAVKRSKYPGAYTATSTAAMGKYNKELLEYYTNQKAKIGGKEFLVKSFKNTDILIDIMNDDGYVNGTIMQIIDHLWDQIPDHEKEQEINEIKKILDM